MYLSFTLNDRPVSVDVGAGESLLAVLRERLSLRSVKDGCAPEGSCGACTVIVDGRAVVSCAQPATRFEGKTVLTVEGLAAERRDLWASTFLAAGAVQCGYCTPGVVMKAEALLARDPRPSRAAIEQTLAGNLCRCTGYGRIVDAIEEAAAVARGEAKVPAPPSGGTVGAPAARRGGREAVLGEQRFVRDMAVPGMLHGALRFAAYPRSRILRIDTAATSAMPGVVAVLTWRDVLGMALTEELRVEAGEPVATTLKSLGMIPAAGMTPAEAILVEEPQPRGPCGAKGAGEAVLVPTSAAVAGALHAFDGTWRTSLPMRDSIAARAALARAAGLDAARAPR